MGVAGVFEFPESWDFEPTVEIESDIPNGSGAIWRDAELPAGASTFYLDVQSLRNGDIGFGTINSIEVGLAGLTVGQLEFDGELRLGDPDQVGLIGRDENGNRIVTAGGSLSIVGGVDDLQRSGHQAPPSDPESGLSFSGVEFTLDGTLVLPAWPEPGDPIGPVELDVNFDADFDVDFKLSNIVELTGVNFAGALKFARSYDTTNEEYVHDFGVRLNNIGLDRMKLNAADLVEFTAINPTINFTDAQGRIPDHIFTSSSVTMDVLGISSTLDNFAISRQLRPSISGVEFAISGMTEEDDNNFIGQAILDWIPLAEVDKLAVRFDEQPFKFQNGEIVGIDPDAISLIFSGDIGGPLFDSDFGLPFTTGVQGLELSLDAVVKNMNADPFDNEFPIRNLNAVTIGIEPMELAPGFKLGGGIGFGSVEVPVTPSPNETEMTEVFYVRIFGDGELAGIGGSAEVVWTEYGPVAGNFSASGVVPLGKTGFVMSGAAGTIQFGAPLPSIDDPADLVTSTFQNPTRIRFANEDVLRRYVAPAVQNNTSTWDAAVTLALRGSFSHIATQEFLEGDVTLATNVSFQGEEAGVRFLGFGDLRIWNQTMASVRMMVDVSDPLNPYLAVAGRLPAPSFPGSLFLPLQGQLDLLIDTQGLAEATMVGVREFVRALADESLEELRNDLYDSENILGRVFERLIVYLNENPSDPLSRQLRDSSVPDFVFTKENLLSRIQALLPTAEQLKTAPPDRLADYQQLGQTFLTSILNAVNQEIVSYGDPTRTTAGIHSQVAPGQVGKLQPQGDQLESLRAFLGLPDLSGSLGAAEDAILIGNEILNAIRLSFRPALESAIEELAAFVDNDELFNPRVIVRGGLRPVLFGIPLGDPLTSGSLSISKHGLLLELDTSITQSVFALAATLMGTVGGGVIGSAAGGAAGAALGLGTAGVGAVVGAGITISAAAAGTVGGAALGAGIGSIPFFLRERIVVRAQLPVDDPAAGLRAILLEDGLPVALPFTEEMVEEDVSAEQETPYERDWLISLDGFIELFGFRSAKLGGTIFPRGSADTLFQPYWDQEIHEFDPTKYNIQDEELWNNLRTYGGAFMEAELRIPRILSRTPEVLSELIRNQSQYPNVDAIKADISGFMGLLQTQLDLIGEEDLLGNVQYYLPSLPIKFNPIDANVFAPGETPEPTSVNGQSEIPAAKPLITFDSAEFNRRSAEVVYFGGKSAPRLLGLQMGESEMRLRDGRFTLTGSIPWLAGLEVDFVFDEHATLTRTVTEDVTTFENTESGVQEVTTTEESTLPIPVIGAEVEIDSARSAEVTRNFLRTVGIPEEAIVTIGEVQAGRTTRGYFRAYSPFYDISELEKEEPDLLKALGGIELGLEFGIKDFIEDAAWTFSISPPTGDAILPDFVATTSVERLRLPGLDEDQEFIDVKDVDLTLTKIGDDLSLHLNGQVQLFGDEGPTFTANGDLVITGGDGNLLRAGIYGEIDLTAENALAHQFSGLDLDGRLFLQINTTGVSQTVERQLFEVDPHGEYLTEDAVLAPRSGSIQLMGSLSVRSPQDPGGPELIDLDGYFNFSNTPEGLSVVAASSLDVGYGSGPNRTTIMTLTGAGGLTVTTQGIAGYLEMSVSEDYFSQYDIATIDGLFVAEFNTTELDQTFTYTLDGETTVRTVEDAPTDTASPQVWSRLLVTDADPDDDVNGATFSIIGLASSLTGEFELIASEQMLSVVTDATLDAGVFGSLRFDGEVEISSAGLRAAAALAREGESLVIGGTPYLEVNTTLDPWRPQSWPTVIAPGSLGFGIRDGQINLGPVSIRDAQVSFVIVDGTISADVRGTVNFLNHTGLTVSGRLDSNLHGELLISVPQLTFPVLGSSDRWSINGTFHLSSNAEGVALRVDGTLAIPTLGRSIGVDGRLNVFGDSWSGSLTTFVFGLPIGPTGTAWFLDGQFSFTAGGTRKGRHLAVGFNGSMRLGGSHTISIPITFGINSRGNVNASFGDLPEIVFGNGDGFLRADLPSGSFNLSRNPITGVIDFAVSFGSGGRVWIPGTNLNVNLPTFSLSSNDTFSIPLVRVNNLNLGGFVRLNGRLYFERVGEQRFNRTDYFYQLRLGDGAYFNLLGSRVDITRANFRSQSLVINAEADQLGASWLGVKNSQFALQSSPNNWSLRLSGQNNQPAELLLPFGVSRDLPTLVFGPTGQGVQSNGNAWVSLPNFQFVEGVGTRFIRNFSLEFDHNGHLVLTLRRDTSNNQVELNFLGSNLSLQSLRMSSNGTLDAIVGGPVKLPFTNYTLGTGTLQLSRNGSNGVLTLDTIDPLTLNLGFMTAYLEGWIRSDATFDVSGATNVTNFFDLLVGNSTVARLYRNNGVFGASYRVNGGVIRLPFTNSDGERLIQDIELPNATFALAGNEPTIPTPSSVLSKISILDGWQSAARESFTVAIDDEGQPRITLKGALTVKRLGQTLTIEDLLISRSQVVANMTSAFRLPLPGWSGNDRPSLSVADTGLSLTWNLDEGSFSTSGFLAFPFAGGAGVSVAGHFTSANDFSFSGTLDLGIFRQTFIADDEGLWVRFNNDAMRYGVDRDGFVSLPWVPFKLALPFTQAAATVFNIFAKITGSNSPISGGLAFIDVDGDGQLNFTGDLNSNLALDDGEVPEPAAITDGNGVAQLPIYPMIDRNGNGQLDADEGIITIVGGVDITKNLPLEVPLRAPGNSSVVNPLTTLVAQLMVGHGLSNVEAEAVVRQAFNLPDTIDLKTFDPLRSDLSPGSLGREVYTASSILQNTVVPMSKVLQAGRTEATVAQAGLVVWDEIAERILAERSSAWLTDQQALTELLTDAADRFQVDTSPAVTATAEVITASHNQLLALPSDLSAEVWAETVFEIQAVAQSDAAEELSRLMTTPSTPPQEVVEQFTGDSYQDRLDAKVVESLQAPQVAVGTPVIVTSPSGEIEAVYTFTLSRPAGRPITVFVGSQESGLLDELLTSITFEPGQTEAIVRVPAPEGVSPAQLRLQPVGIINSPQTTVARGASLEDALVRSSIANDLSLVTPQTVTIDGLNLPRHASLDTQLLSSAIPVSTPSSATLVELLNRSGAELAQFDLFSGQSSSAPSTLDRVLSNWREWLLEAWDSLDEGATDVWAELLEGWSEAEDASTQPPERAAEPADEDAASKAEEEPEPAAAANADANRQASEADSRDEPARP